MRRIQFYPNAQLEQKLKQEADALGVSVSALVVDLLSTQLGLASTDQCSESQLTQKVFEEVKEFVSASCNSGAEFDLLTASKTFRTIEMCFAGKPSTIRAKIGKEFSKQIDEGHTFPNVTRAYKPSGKLKKSVNNATIYKIKSQCTAINHNATD